MYLARLGPLLFRWTPVCNWFRRNAKPCSRKVKTRYSETLFSQIRGFAGGSFLQSAEGVADDTLIVKPGLRILLVEDNLLNQKLLVLMLKQLGCECDAAMDGQEALEAVERRCYDVVLMDVQMPRMDGWAATREIRRREGLAQGKPALYIIGQTACATADDAAKCRDAGMDVHLAKPISLKRLAEALAGAN